MRRDMTDAAVQREALYPKTHQRHVLKPVAFAWRLTRELATLHIRPPVRRWRTKAGADLLPEQVARIEKIYKGAQVNRRLRTFHEHLVGLNQATMLVWPIDRPSGFKGVRLIVIPAFEQAVKLDEPTSDSERDVASWFVRLPVAQDPIIDELVYSVAEITPTTAVWQDGPSEVRGKGVWSDEGTNPCGDIPMVIGRNAEAAAGEFWAPAPEDILAAQRAINHDHTDVGHFARMQGAGVPVLRGMSQDAADDLEIGPDAVVGIPDTDGDFAFASARPDLKGNLATGEAYTRAVVATSGLNPATYLKTTAATAIAKKVELLDRDAERVRHVAEFARVEQRLYDLMRRWLGALHGTPDWLPEAVVTVEYREPVVAVDKLHDSQGDDLDIKMGLTSRAQIVARRDGLTLEEAEARVAENLAKQQEQAPPKPAGPAGNLVGLTGGGRRS